MRVAVILLPCITALAAAQLHDGEGGAPQKGLPIALRSARLQRLPSSRPIAPTQSVFANQRLRRPIPFKPKGSAGEDGFATGAGNYPSAKPVQRPNLPSAPAFSQPVKPVNEEPEEDERFRDSSHNDDRDDDRSLSQEEEEFEDESEESVPRTPNFGSSGSGGSSRGPAHSGGSNPPQSQITQVQYRSFTPSAPTGRGAPATPPPPPVVQYRPPQKPTKPRKQIVEEPIRQPVKAPPKPVKSPQDYYSRGNKKPVAQIIRRYRNDNDDGSITWGFENDDGSYKEELIGIDCITRGKYGYIDPDGIRREYTYETGIKCDEEQREEDEENGFVDYQENKIVLPDGKTIDLSSMGKKQTRRPRPY